MMPSIPVYQDEYLTILCERDGKLFRSIRSNRTFPDVDSLDACYDRMLTAIRPYLRRDSVLLSDVRQAPGRNDPVFEKAMEDVRLRVYPVFRKRAILVQSTIGKLHIARLIQHDKLERMVSQDEAELLRYLDT